MRRAVWLVAPSVMALIAACSSPGAGGSDAGPGGGTDGGTPEADGSAPGADGSTPGPDGGTDGGKPTSANLKLTAATLANVGRKGIDLQIALTGSDTKGRTSSAHLSFLDASDNEITAFDTNWDGVADATERRAFFDTSASGKTSFTSTITFPGILTRVANIEKVKVSLQDATNARSNELVATLSRQTQGEENDPCDTKMITSRCAPGLSCAGAPATCKAGVAPQFNGVAYYNGPRGPVMLFRGTEPDQDMSNIDVEFLNGAGAPVAIDLNNDGNMTSAFSIDAKASSATSATFFLQNDPAAGFETMVPKIRATPRDLFGHTGNAVIAAVTTAPVKGVGQACDPYGFDACTGGNLCAPGIPGATNTCTSGSSLRTTACSASVKLDTSKTTLTAYGRTQGVSLWEPPSGCVTGDATGRPEGIISLHVAAATPKLTLTTALPETEFDTAIYLVPGCAASGASALGCNDDVQGFSSTLVLNNVPAGDYTIVVEAVSRTGGIFGVNVKLD